MSPIINRLKETAARHYKPYEGRFPSFELFENSLIDCYRLIAWRVAMKWEDFFGDPAVTRERIGALRFLENCPIHSSEFSALIPHRRQFRPPYTACLESLANDQIIHICPHYSNNPSKPFSKKYGLANSFIKSTIASRPQDTIPADIYDALDGHCPKVLLRKKIRDSAKIYNALKETDGIKVVLPQLWDTQCNDRGYFAFNPELSIDNLLLGLKSFKKQTIRGYRKSRYYDWFVSCPSAFRTLLHVGDRPYRELVDCPSGMFWMMSIYGYQKGQISKEECRKIIRHCFSGTFYSDLSGEKKTRFIKTQFMLIPNSTKRGFAHLNGNALCKRICCSLAKEYPMLWDMFSKIREDSPNPGEVIYAAYSPIEKHSMEELDYTLTQNGLTHLRRVHDAIYGIDEIPEPEARDLLQQIALKELSRE